ncbi:MAG: SDR family NAD(P)-dependent oxidoreductase [Bacteroidales bacterium]
MKKIILITGATSGIGEALAIKLAKEGYSLILTGRRAERLEKLKIELFKEYSANIKTLCFDIRDKESVFEAIDQLPQEWSDISVLVNNAGLAAGLAPIQDSLLSDWEQMIDTNLKGLLYITKAILPKMIKKQKGHIVNVGSIAGIETYQNGNVYCATKHAVNSLTSGMRMDLVKFGIKVSQVLPGAVNTEFSLVRFKGDTDRANKVYDGFKPLCAQDIADAIQYIIEAPDHVNISDMVILPSAQASAAITERKQ